MNITNSDIAQDWIDGQTAINLIIGGIVADTTLRSFIDPRFKFTMSNDCNTLYFDDVTTYSVDTNDVEISVELLYRNKFLQETVCDSARVMAVNGRETFVVEDGDGEYCMRITMTYNEPDGLNPPIVWTEIIDDCLYIDCCRNKGVALIEEVNCRIATIGCKIDKYACIGRSTTKLFKAMHRLQNILWCLCNFHISCALYNIYACDVNRLKNC